MALERKGKICIIWFVAHEKHILAMLVNLFFVDPGLFLAAPLAVMYTAAIAIKYVQVMYSHLRKITEITRLL